ncbi:MAG: GGDEF domain-containing protein [Pseudomonadota bacterium]
MVDNRTLMLAGFAASLIFVLTMLVISFTNRRYRGLWWWTLGNCIHTFSFIAFVLQDYGPPWYWGLLAGNVASLAGVICWNFSLRQFLGLKLAWRAALTSLLIATGLMHYFSAWRFDTTMRIVFISLSYVVWCLDIGLVMGKGRAIISPASRYVFQAVALGLGAFFLFRAVATLLLEPVQTVFQPSWLMSLAMGVLMTGMMAFNICFLILVAVRHEQDLQEKITELNQEIELRHTLEERLAREATLDPLTGAANRRKLDEIAHRSLALARRHRRELGLVLLDIDHFKAINDRFGHQVGDQVLIELVRAIQADLREEDSLARYGGEEFVALLPDTGLDQALEIAERLRRLVEGLRLAGAGAGASGPVRLTLSLGVSAFQAGDGSLGPILARADVALYQAKAGGRNQVCAALAGPEGAPEVFCPPRPAPAPA